MDTKEKLLMYGGFVGKRNTPKEKDKFLRCIAKEFMDLGYDVKASSHNVRFKKIVNLYVGDVQNASRLIVCNYDTPLMQMGFNIPYYPFEYKQQEHANMKAQILAQVCIIISVVLYSILIVVPNLSNHVFDFKDILSVIGLIILIGCVALLFQGIGNTMNFNRNTSGILMCIALAHQLANSQNYAFAFTDMGCQSSIGLEYLKHDFSKSIDQKQVYLIEPIGVGTTLAIASNDSNKAMRDDFIQHVKHKESIHYVNKEMDDYTSVNVFKHAIAIARGSEAETTVKILNTGTRKDSEVDFNKIEEIVTAFVDMQT